MRWLLLSTLIGCGSSEGTWLLHVDRAALVSEGCTTGTLDGQTQFEATVYVDADQASMWVPARGALLTGTWDADAVDLAQETDQALSGSVIGLRATATGTTLAGDWIEATPSLAEPTCTRTFPLAGERLSHATVAP